MNAAQAGATIAFLLLAMAPASAQNVKITPIGSHPGELCANDRAISDTQPGRERPPNRLWGEGQGSRGGVAHVPAVLRGVVGVGKNRRRIDPWSARRYVPKLSRRIRLRARAAL